MGSDCKPCKDDAGLVNEGEIETKKISLSDIPPTPKKRRRAAQEDEMPMMNSAMFSRIDKKSYLSSASRKSRLSFEKCKILGENWKIFLIDVTIPSDAPQKLCQNPSSENEDFDLKSIYIGAQLEGKKEGVGKEYIIITETRSSKVVILAFLGEFKNDKFERGVRFHLRYSDSEEQVEMMKVSRMDPSENKENQFFGLKVVLSSKGDEKYWGVFDQANQTVGTCKNLCFSKERKECFYFEGSFKDGNKNGNGILKVFDRNPEAVLSRRVIEEQIKQLKVLFVNMGTSDFQKFYSVLDTILEQGAKYDPAIEKLQGAKTVIEATWSNDKINGFTIEHWPLKNYKYVGQYRNNQRNGYVEEFEDDTLVSKAFYKNGGMQKMKDNQYQLKGGRIQDGKFQRRAEVV